MTGGAWAGFFDLWLEALVRASVHGAIAIGLVWAICRAAPRLSPGARCWLWRLALLKMVLALLPFGALDLPLLPSSWSTGSNEAATGPRVPATAPEVASPVASTPSGFESPAAISKTETPGSFSYSASPSPPSMPWGKLALFTTWFVVAVGFLGVLMVRVRAARRDRQQWRLVKDHDLLTLNERLAGQIGLFQPPVLFESDACPSPVVFGMIRTSIILPSLLVKRSTPAEMQLILAHEMAHIRRWDLLGNWLSTVVSAFFFFHPLVWLALRESQLDEELACDELAVRQPDASVADYGRLLVDLATRFQRVGLPVATVGITESFQVLLKRRLRALKTFGVRSRGIRALSWALAGVALIGLLPWRLVAASSSTTNAKTVHEAFVQAVEPVDARCRERVVDVQAKSGPWTIAVDRVRRHAGDGFAITAVPSGLPMLSSRRFPEVEGNDRQPDLILDLVVKGPKTDTQGQWICGTTGPLWAVDDQGRKCGFVQLDDVERVQARGVDYPTGDGRLAIHLRLPKEKQAIKKLRSVQGTLLVVEGRVHRLEFDESDVSRLLNRTPKNPVRYISRKYPGHDGPDTVAMTDVERAEDGCNVLLAVSWPPGPHYDLTLKYNKQVLDAYSRMNVVLNDSLGRTHLPGYRWNGGTFDDPSGPTIAVCDGNARLSRSQWASWPAAPCSLRRFSDNMLMHQFHFDPLSDGATVKSFTCTITEWTGPPRKIPFRLENIPLPE
ncbi:MAG: M56 family metallopeptidase [Pirellulales bacterium]|nr:M56 family metallopeptidase [Pirellulales bacterium]